MLNFDRNIGAYGRLDSQHNFYVGEEDGRLAAGEPMPSGMLGSARIPRLGRGVYGLAIPELRAQWGQERSPGLLIASLRKTVQAVSEWENRLSQTVAEQQSTQMDPLLEFYNDRISFGYLDIEFTGSGSLSLKTGYLLPLLNKSPPELTKLHRISSAPGKPGAPPDSSLAVGMRWPALAKGEYVVEFDLRGASLGSLFERHPESVRMAVFARPVADPGSYSSLVLQ